MVAYVSFFISISEGIFMAEEKEWYRLDNAAKIIPATMTGADTRVFRLVCELKEEVDPDVLQEALEDSLREYPYMNCCMRKGVFWYYLDELKTKAVVQKDSQPALQALYRSGRKNLLYRLCYLDRRIVLEMFHVLSDGTGGFMFFEHIVSCYLIRKHHIDPSRIKAGSSSMEERQQDAFSQFYEKGKSKKRNFLKEMFPVTAYRLRGREDDNLQEHLIEGTVSAAQVVELAHRFHVTVGVLVTSLWVEAILKQMRHSEYEKPVVVSVPVNLRQFFPSETARNFFGVINVAYDPRQYDGNLESVLSVIDTAFQEELTPEKVQATMNSYAELEHNYAVKLIPLPLKEIGLMGITHMMNRGVTTSVSNVGKVVLPEELDPYVEKFCSFMACKTIFVCISTFHDHMVFGITSCFERHPTACSFFRRLTELGVRVEIATNDWDREAE